ncbi:PREDICTED: protein PRR14L [Pseudopodoces humilis]|uniref:protein PRR14L n=1 Tax=Pseudopodoces humilis TaxID=181119 RepID=UPI0006B74719|nr:PREDICTED: protein PRR14L [Pseudopodoces humilis]XP_014109350.1 PREDICTED: protein PRR14L [Pseudopodoces humilis]
MLSSGVESLLDSSVSAVIEELYTGLPESISTELMAVPGPSLGLDAQSDGPVPVLAHRDGPWTSATGNFCQKTEHLGDMLQVISHGPAESFPEELLQAGDLAEDEKSRRGHFRKLDCSSDGYQKEDVEAQGAEDHHHAECCPLTLGEGWSEQKDPHLNEQGTKSLRTCCAETAVSLRNTEENQANVQVTAETLPKLTEEVQGMKADGTRIFSKAGCRNDRVSKGLPSESNQYPDVDTVMARAGVSETNILGFLEPLKVMDIGAATDYPQETSDYSVSKAHAAMPLRAGGNGVSVLEIREEKLPRQNRLNEFSSSFANCQTCQQDEENYAYDFFKGTVPEQNEPHELFSAESCRTLSTQSSEVLCPVLKSISYVDFGNTSLESCSAVHGIISETPQKYLPQNIKHHTLYDHGTGFLENQTSTSVPVEQISVVRNKGLSSAKPDLRELSATTGKSHSSEPEEAAEVWRKIAVGDNTEMCSWPEAQEAANSEHCCSPVFSSVAPSSDKFSKEKFKILPSEGDKLKKDQWQSSVSDPCKNDIKENCLWVETSNIASHETGQRGICFYSTANKIPPLSNHSCLDLGTKLGKDSPRAQLLEKESESNITSEEFADSLVGAPEAESSDSLSTGSKTNLFYTLNVTLPPVLQKSREPHYNECLPCTANEVSCRDQAWGNLSRRESVGASGTTVEPVAEVLLHEDKFKSSVNSMTFDNPNTAIRISQMNVKSSAGNMERVVTGLENEHCHTWICNNQNIKKQCTAASTSCILSGSTRVDEVFLDSHSFGVEVGKIEENDNLEGESSSGYNSKEAIIFPEAHAPLARGSLCENDWGNRGIALYGINDIPTGKPMFCSAYTAEKSTATLARDEISNKNMEVVEQLELCKVTGSEIVSDREEAKEQIGICASQRDEFDKTRAVDSQNAPESHQRNKTSEQLLVRYLNKNTCAHNFGFYNSLLGPRKRELNTCEQEEMPLLTADPSECSTSTCDPHPAPDNVNIPTQHAGQTEETLCLMGNQFHPCQRESDVPVLGSEQHLESLTNQPNTGLQTMGGSVEKDEIGPNHTEEVLLKIGGDLPLLDHKYAREARFEGGLQENVMGLDSLIGVKNEDSLGYMDSISDLIEQKTVRLQECENRCERNNKGTLEENFFDDKQHCSQQVHFIVCAKEKAELEFAGKKAQKSLPKMKWLVENQENTISAQFLPISSVHGSLSYKPENRNVLSDTENRESLTPILNNSCPQLTFEPGKETDAQMGVCPSHLGMFDIQESCVETQADSETVSALHSHISLPEKEELHMSPESTQRDSCDLSAAEAFSKGISMTKILSVTISVKKKSSNVEVPSSGNGSAAGSLNGAKSSRVRACSKGSLEGEGLCTPTVKGMDMSSPKSPSGEEKFKNTDKLKNWNVLSDTENREKLSITPILNNSCPQLTFEPGKETGDQRGICAFHSEKFDIKETSNRTQMDSETMSALNSHISLPEKEKLCMSPENTQRDTSSSDKKFSKDSSMTKILSVKISVKKKSSNVEVPSSGNESAAGSLNDAKSSRVRAHSKGSLEGEGLCTPTVKGMDMSSPKSPSGEEKLKNTCVEKIEKEVAPRGRLPKDCPRALEYSKESGSKIVPLRTENYGKVLEEIRRSKLNNLSKERQNDTKLPNLAHTSVLSQTVHDYQAGAVSDTEAAPEAQDDTTPTFSPPPSTLSDSCKQPSPNCVVCSEACVLYKLNAQSKDNVNEVTEGQDSGLQDLFCKQNGTLGSERLNQIEERQVLKQKKYGKMEVHQLGKAQQEQKLEHQEKAKIILQPSMLHSSELLQSSSAELMTSRNTKFGGTSEEILAVRGSESKLCSTLQEVKTPKITTDFISSQFLKTQDLEIEKLNLNLGYDGIPGAFGTTNKQRGTTNKLRGPLPLKIQPGRACKKVPTLYQLKTGRKIKKIKSSPFFEIPLEVLPKQENTLLESLYFPCKPPTVEKETAMRFAHMPRQRAKGCSLLNSLKFRKCTKDPALLSKLSAMANKLLAPAKSSRNLERLPYSSEILPVGDRYSQCRAKNLLEAFSCINRNVHSRWADSWCTKMFSFQPLALYPVQTTKILSSDLSHTPPIPFLDTSVFPISFHIKLDSSPVTDLRGITSQHSVHHNPVFRETPAPASKWTLSFLLSQSCSDTTAFKEDSSVNNELHSSHSTTTPRTVAVHPDPRINTVAGRRGGCSTLGLHTVLALSSPGCYRIWTRRRNLTSHIPTIQRLFISQLAQGLKGDRYPRCVSDDLVSSLPYSLGRVLSIWSQHGPSACPSEITSLHSNHCKWQPSVGIENSCAMLPHLPVQSMGALQTTGHVIRLETSFPLPLPKPHALPESLPSPPRLSASELQIPALDEADASVPACLRSQDDTELKKTEPEKRPKKVSQIRIRKTVPKPDPNLTPMGLPKPKRLKKKEFSLEEIYTNKNYKSPPPARSLETIFEEPKEKNGHLISVSQQKRKRILEFQDFTLPRKRKIRGKIKAVGSFTRAKRAALQSAELDVLLSQKLMDLEAFFAEEVEQEQASSI